MPDFKLPLSGDVSQAFSWFGGASLISVNMGKSSDPDVEQRVLSDAASYGKQIGRIEDALEVLIEHFHPDRALNQKEEQAIKEMRRLLDDVADVKNRRSSKSTGR